MMGKNVTQYKVNEKKIVNVVDEEKKEDEKECLRMRGKCKKVNDDRIESVTVYERINVQS